MSIKTKENSITEEALKIESYQAQFYLEMFFDLLLLQQRNEQEWEKTEKLIRERKRKKRKKYWEETNGAEHQKNQWLFCGRRQTDSINRKSKSAFNK